MKSKRNRVRKSTRKEKRIEKRRRKRKSTRLEKRIRNKD